ncbi:B-cell receptor CD22-like isoform X5 [Anguilla anguilla]|uniref:B-cell receptor CD22-like isoform X5 n=1 Tax=Anguilla anguilla TaxID=7936 RepID=UPI0015AC5A4D|nr:B-cell receptor CD22-like isoform X5 [Anguilla anguilla]
MLLKKSGSLVVVLLLTGSGVLVQAGWSVAHSPGTVCALQGASVVLPCTYTYPSPYQVMKTIWFGVFNKQETNLESLSEYSGHWTYIGNRMNNCSLRITDLKNSYALEYRFRFETDISGGQFTGKPGVQLLVTDLQVMVNPDTVTEGQSVILTCSTTCTLTGSPAFIWYRDGSPLPFTNQSHLFTASREDRGNYTCAVKGYEHLPSSAVILSVTYGPKDTSLSVSPSGEILEGSSVTLTCSSDANPPVQRYTWYKNNRALASWTGSGLNHAITNIVSEDSGQYYCEARNQNGAENSSAVTIDVQYAPKNTSISVSPSGEIMAGSSVTLTCSSDANPPVQRYTWFKNNRAVASWTGSGLNHTITNIVSEDSGQYYCETRNQHGTQNSSAAVTIDVQFAPKDTSVSVSPSGEIVEGRSVNLTCSSDAKPPVQRYTWFKKNDTGVWQAGSGQSLNFSNFRSWNRGQYYCEAQNRHGAQNSTGLTVSYAAVANYKHDLAYIITGTCALAALLIVIVLAVCRRCHSVKEAKLNTEILQDAACAVYANVPGRTASTAPPGKTVPGKEEAEHSNVQRPHSQDQEEVQYASVQKPAPPGEEDVQYASIRFSRSGAAPRSTVPASEAVIYSTVAKGNT